VDKVVAKIIQAYFLLNVSNFQCTQFNKVKWKYNRFMHKSFLTTAMKE